MKHSILLLFAVMALQTSQAQMQLPNGNFEDTTVVNLGGNIDTISSGWSTSGFGAGVTTDAADGNFAAYVWNWYYYGRGYAVNGNASMPELAGTPIDYRPNKLTGYSKYELGEVQTTNDSAFIMVTLLKFNPATHHRDTLGRGYKTFGPNSEYSPFEIDITYNSALQPDTVVVHVVSSISGFCGENSGGNCLYFYVDQLELSQTTTGISENVSLNKPSFFPNPTENYITLSKGAIQAGIISIYSLDGKLAWQQSMNQPDANTIDLSNLKRGVYFVKLGDSNSMEKLVLR